MPRDAKGNWVYQPRGYTYKPCPGCGGVELRPSKGVCGECKSAIDSQRALREEIKARGSSVLHQFDVPKAPHWLPYISHDHYDDSGHSRPVQTAFHKLAMEVSQKNDGRAIDFQNVPDLFNRLPGDNHCSSNETRLFDKRVALALRALFDCTRKVTEHAYKEGVQYGRSLLMQLNAGDISPSDFNRQSEV